MLSGQREEGTAFQEEETAHANVLKQVGTKQGEATVTRQASARVIKTDVSQLQAQASLVCIVMRKTTFLLCQLFQCLFLQQGVPEGDDKAGGGESFL